MIRDARPSDAHAIACVHVASWHSAYRELLPEEAIAARTVEQRLEQWQPALVARDRFAVVACDDASGTIQGFASGRIFERPDNGFESYLESLYVLVTVQRRGIGRELLRVLATRLRAAGAQNMALRTLRLGPARFFYEHLGARLVPEGIAKDADRFDDDVYGFDDLGALGLNSN